MGSVYLWFILVVDVLRPRNFEIFQLFGQVFQIHGIQQEVSEISQIFDLVILKIRKQATHVIQARKDDFFAIFSSSLGI